MNFKEMYDKVTKLEKELDMNIYEIGMLLEITTLLIDLGNEMTDELYNHIYECVKESTYIIDNTDEDFISYRYELMEYIRDTTTTELKIY